MAPRILQVVGGWDIPHGDVDPCKLSIRYLRPPIGPIGIGGDQRDRIG